MIRTPSFYRFLKQSELPEDKHFLAHAMLSPAANTTFQRDHHDYALPIRKLDLEVWKRRYAQQEAGQPIENQFDLLDELAPTLGQSLHVEETIRVITIENCHRRVPFPEDLFRGRFDQRWGWKDGRCGRYGWATRCESSMSTKACPFTCFSCVSARY